MTGTKCKAESRERCPFHGTRSASHTRRLRDRMLLSREVLKAANTESEQLNAQMYLEEAEIDYYGTDEGRMSLETHIQNTVNKDVQAHWMMLLSKADIKREFNELHDQYIDRHRQHVASRSIKTVVR
jgi:hypothetical protein